MFYSNRCNLERKKNNFFVLQFPILFVLQFPILTESLRYPLISIYFPAHICTSIPNLCTLSTHLSEKRLMYYILFQSWWIDELGWKTDRLWNIFGQIERSVKAWSIQSCAKTSAIAQVIELYFITIIILQKFDTFYKIIENIWEDSLDLIQSPSVTIQIVGKKFYLGW